MPPFSRLRRIALAAAASSITLAAVCTPSNASNLLDLPPDDDRDPRISGVWYFNYVHEDVFQRPDQPDRPEDFSRFEIQRGYLTYRTEINHRLSARVTSDISVDQEGDGAGDVELRLKYGYVDIDTGELGLLRSTRLRAGVLQTPWISFEQSINDFRLQGPMFLNRARVFISADFGVGFFANLGEPVDAAYRRDVNRRHAGRWGSVAVGIYNGGGYNEIERNETFVPQARLTLRPLPDLAPGLQLSAGGAVGKGNTAAAPDYHASVLMLSHETRRHVLTATVYTGEGDLRGNAIASDGRALDQRGASVFTELRVRRDYSLIGRFDLLRTEAEGGDRDVERWIVGIAWRCFPGGQLLVDYQNQKSLGGPFVQRNEQVEVGLEVRF